MRFANPGVFDHAPRYHAGGVAGSGLLPDEVPIIARRGELVVPPERVVREQESAGAQRPNQQTRLGGGPLGAGRGRLERGPAARSAARLL